MKYLILPVMCFSLMFFALTDVFDVYAAGMNTTDPQFKNPIEAKTVNDLFDNIYKAILEIVGVLAVIMIVIGGILYMTSAGDQGRVQLAKTTVTAAIIGLALAVAAPTFLKEIYHILGGTAPSDVVKPETKEISEILGNLLTVLLDIIGTLSVLMLVIGGIMYMTASGDQTRADTAKRVIKYAIIGLVVAILSLTIVHVVTDIL